MNNIETDLPVPFSRLVLFDFDGTLTRGDTFGAFLVFSVPWWKLATGTFSLLFILAPLVFLEKNTRAERAKAAILKVFFGGKSREELERTALAFCEKRLPRLLRPPMMKLLEASRDAGDTVAVVSASMDLWLQPFCKQERILLICTELAYDAGIFTGRFATPNCNRQEKARRIREVFRLEQFAPIVAYGNSAGDAAMFELAHEAWYCLPDGRMKKWEST